MSDRPFLRQNIFLIGDVNPQIYGHELPSNLQVFKVFFFNLRQLKLNVRRSATLAVQEVLIYWEKPGIPVMRIDNCIVKMEKLYENWRKVQKAAGQEFNRKNEEEFCRSFNYLFDIAHSKALDIIDEHLKTFLLDQRKPDRIGFIGGIETFLDTVDISQTSSKKRKRDTSKFTKIFLAFMNSNPRSNLLILICFFSIFLLWLKIRVQVIKIESPSSDTS